MRLAIAIAILREGSKFVLFLFGSGAEGTEGAWRLPIVGLGGLMLGAICSLLLYRGLLAIPANRLFAVTGALVIFWQRGWLVRRQRSSLAPISCLRWATSFGTAPSSFAMIASRARSCTRWWAIPIDQWESRL